MTDYDKKQIELANYWFDLWIRDENYFIDFLNNSEPLQYCFTWGVYPAMVRSGELPKWYGGPTEDKNILDAVEKAKQWSNETDSDKVKRIAKCIMILYTLAEKRLEVTAGI